MAGQEQFILSVTENGYGKCSSSYEYRVSGRGGLGVLNFATSKKVGQVVGLMVVSGARTEELMLITNLGRAVRCSMREVRVTGRNASGVILLRTSEGEKVVSAALVQGELDDADSEA